ncbi:ty3-gypsy retrotransposon protein, partial [Tanacetum coccineum]
MYEPSGVNHTGNEGVVVENDGRKERRLGFLEGKCNESFPIRRPHALSQKWRLNVQSEEITGSMSDFVVVLQPEAVLGVRPSKEQKDGQEVLIRWKNLPLYDASWEQFDYIEQQFPEFHLEDKSLQSLVCEVYLFFLSIRRNHQQSSSSSHGNIDRVNSITEAHVVETLERGHSMRLPKNDRRHPEPPTDYMYMGNRNQVCQNCGALFGVAETSKKIVRSLMLCQFHQFGGGTRKFEGTSRKKRKRAENEDNSDSLGSFVRTIQVILSIWKRL